MLAQVQLPYALRLFSDQAQSEPIKLHSLRQVFDGSITQRLHEFSLDVAGISNRPDSKGDRVLIDQLHYRVPLSGNVSQIELTEG